MTIQQIYWHPTTQIPADTDLPLPNQVDVAILGGGYTGLSAARTLAQQGARVGVLEAETIGWGASSRNGGMVLTGLKLGMGTIQKRSFTDAALGPLIDHVRSLKDRPTLVVVTSDHGEALGDHGEATHGLFARGHAARAAHRRPALGRPAYARGSGRRASLGDAGAARGRAAAAHLVPDVQRSRYVVPPALRLSVLDGTGAEAFAKAMGTGEELFAVGLDAGALINDDMLAGMRNSAVTRLFIDPSIDPANGTDYTTFLDANALQGARLGIARGMFGNNGLVAGVIEQALADLSRLGAEIVELKDFKASGEVDDAEWIVLQYEFKDGLNAYLPRWARTPRTRRSTN